MILDHDISLLSFFAGSPFNRSHITALTKTTLVPQRCNSGELTSTPHAAFVFSQTLDPALKSFVKGALQTFFQIGAI